MSKKWIIEHKGNIEIHNSLKSIERENLIYDKETKDGIKETKINARLISKSVKEILPLTNKKRGYYIDNNYKIYQSQIINNK